MTNLIRSLRDCTSGAALMETAIVFPLILTMMVGVLEIGHGFQDYHTADKSMRNAARYLARVPADAVCGWGWVNARELAIFGMMDPPEGQQPLIPDWDEDTLTLVRDPICANPAAEPMTVTIEAIVPIPTPLLSAIGMPTTVNMRVRHEERHIGG